MDDKLLKEIENILEENGVNGNIHEAAIELQKFVEDKTHKAREDMYYSLMFEHTGAIGGISD